ncbi:sigma-70 family RNA polymerase sigma factor [Corynebacterium hylobatis]|uniref:Sigma-70 family RNA polymerase sigma factor n=1 Tax=Corynebacterium hylobatis TaxID=1859290 RepID=A0A430HXW7_9CORY|nr:sigma-70 family RNA polymerase sigma factor [Corynebacterium hylobatis]RSZ62886.1 sigma-70 family RNA polymerase sigma factor [Corynebacterium hylobatis]
MSDRDTLWLRERPRLLAIAYNILGSWADAEDTVSEAWLRLRSAPELIDARAWLTVITSRIALDIATSAARARTDYIGPWLPEIVVLDEPGPEDRAVLQESVDLALVRMLQELEPPDRVILVLADVFDVSFRDIAEVLGSTPAATRQKASRARRNLARAEAAGGSVAPAADLAGLARALQTGDLAQLTHLLSEGCVLWTDSGGLTRAARRPIHGADKVARFLAGIIGTFGMPTLTVEPAVGGAVIRAESEDQVRMVVVEVAEGRITGLQIQQNPAKVRHC